jgi:hypothetical protein
MQLAEGSFHEEQLLAEVQLPEGGYYEEQLMP